MGFSGKHLALVAAVAGALRAAAAVSLYSTLGGGFNGVAPGLVVSGPSNGYQPGVTYQIAAPFTVSETLPLDAVRLALQHVTYYSGTAPLTVSVFPNENVSGIDQPSASPLEQTVLAGVPDTASVVTAEFGNATSLQASTLYWVVLSAGDPATLDIWLYSSSTSTNATTAFRGNAGPWTVTSTANSPELGFEVLGFVPEAGTLAAGAGMAAGALVLAARRVRRASPAGPA